MKKAFIIIGVIVVVGVGGFMYRQKTKLPTYQSERVERRTITQEVNVTGRVEPVENVSLSFEASGRVVETRIKVGDLVTAGAILVRLNDAELQADLAQARAAVESARAELDQRKSGPRDEEIRVAERKVSNAEKTLIDANANRSNVQRKDALDLENLYGDIPDILQDAYAKADDAVQHKINALFDGDNTSSPTITFLTSASQAKIDAETLRVSVAGPIASLLKLAGTNTSSHPESDMALRDAVSDLVEVRSLLERVGDALNSSLGVSATTLSTYKSDLNAARNNVNTVLATITSQKQSIASQQVTIEKNIATENAKVSDAESALALANDQLRLTRAGYTAEQIRVQESVVAQTQANVQNIEARLSKMTLRAPIAGVVTKQDAKVGQSVVVNVPVVEIISGGSFEMKANVPEADIAKVALETPAWVTLDAYGDSVQFEAEVVKIDPGETIIEGVPTYSVTLHFSKNDERIRSGMTANIDMITATRENVLAVPFRAVKADGVRKYVQIVLEKNDLNERDVTLGLRGSDGYVEVVEGLQEREEVVTVSRE